MTEMIGCSPQLHEIINEGYLGITVRCFTNKKASEFHGNAVLKLLEGC